jgi:hypothetical protein
VTARPGQGEALTVWAMWAAVSLAVLVTYSWVDKDELYNVSREGLAGGLGRSVVLLNFPIAFVAVATTLVAVAVLSTRAWLLAAPAIASCVLVPFVVDEDDLDVRPANAIPALGVLVALVLTIVAARRTGLSVAPRRRGDVARVVIAIGVVVISLPWITAALGFHFPGDFFLGEELHPEDDGTPLAAVHLGHHHGTDGAFLILTALLLSRVHLPQRWLDRALTLYLGLMLAYGAVNMAQDFWLEQIVKRGWTETEVPDALLPGLRPIWVVILALAVLSAILLAHERRAEHAPAYSRPWLRSK